MSLFGSKTRVIFGSVVYNMAGPEANRPHYLKTTLISAILNNSPSISNTITNSYLTGPGVTLRSFTDWAQTSGLNAAIGFQGSTLNLAQTVDRATLAALIPHPVGQTVSLQTVSMGFGDYTQWADQFVAAYYPSLFGTAYTSSIDDSTNIITVFFADTTTTTFSAPNYSPMELYIYAGYCLVTPPVTDPLVTGSTVTLGSGGKMPSTVGWTLVSSSGGVSVWERTDYQGMNSSSTGVTSLRRVMTQTATPSPGSYRIDTQVIHSQTLSGMTMLIYEKGTGNVAMDALFVASSSGGGFFPFLPIRLASKFVSPSFLPDVYALSKKALNKAIKGKLDSIIASVAANSSLSNISDAYIVFGASLNTKNNSTKKYIYQFFKEVTIGQDLTGSAYLAWRTEWVSINTQVQQNYLWMVAQSNPSDPLWSTPQPAVDAYVLPPTSSITVNSNGRPGINYASTVSWNGIIETSGSGLKIAGAVPGNLWFENVTSDTASTYLNSNGLRAYGTDVAPVLNQVRLNWQVNATHWRSLDIYGLVHNRLLFHSSSITTTGNDALLNTTSESEFIIPLHNGVFRDMSLVDSTEMSTGCVFIVFTTAVVTKTPWYATAVFKIFIFIVIIIIAVVFTIYTFGAGTPGVLGTAGAVGTALGASGTAAIILGFMVNTIAAMVLARIIIAVWTVALGPKIGALVGNVFAVIYTAGIASYTSTASLASNFSGMMSVMNLAKLTLAVGNGISSYMDSNTVDIMNKTHDLITSYNQDSKEIQQQSAAFLDSSNGIIDAFTFSNIGLASEGNGLISVSNTSSTDSAIEPLDVFLGRTLLTGTDLAGLSLDMIGNFAKLTLNSDLPI
jgi:hypothetical protein